MQTSDNFTGQAFKIALRVSAYYGLFGICGIMLVRGDKLVSEALSPGVEF